MTYTKPILLNGISYSIETILSGNFERTALSTFELDTLSFCKEWIEGKQTFTIHTSGSTGTPKPIHILRSQMAASADMTVQALGLSAEDTALVCLNTGYIAGKMMLVRAFETGMKAIAVTPSNNPFDEVPEGTTLDFVAIVPLQLQSIINAGEQALAKLNNMRAIIVGGAPVNHTLEKLIKEKVKAPLYSTYGMTETVSHIALKRLNGPHPNDYFQLFDEVQTSIDARGCLTIQSVLTNHQKIITNDLVRIVDKKQFEWLGRVDNVINSGGVKIQIEKVEKAIAKVFTAQEISSRFFIAGLPHQKLGEEVVLFVEGKPLDLAQIDEILNLTKSRTEKYEAPKRIVFIDTFAETATGKVKRKESISQLTSP